MKHSKQIKHFAIENAKAILIAANLLFVLLLVILSVTQAKAKEVELGVITDFIPVIQETTSTSTSTTTTTSTTSTLPDLSDVDWISLARSEYGKCGEWYTTAISVGWPAEEWVRLQQVIWRESRCLAEAFNGADAGLVQINKVHSKWMSDFGYSFPDDMFVPEKNLTFALALWNSSGWKPWRFSGTTWNE